MAQYVVTDTELTAVANAIRTKGGTSADLEWNSGFISAIQAISGGGGGEGTVPAVVTASSTYGSTYTPEKAIGDEVSNFWGSNGNATDWLQLHFLAAIKITKIRFGNTRIDGSLHWTSARVVFQASSDGSTWVDLYDAQNLSDSADNLFEYSLQNDTEYEYYRFFCYKGSFYGGLGKVKLSYEAQSGSGASTNIYSGTDAPTSGTGRDGDLYLKYDANDEVLGGYVKKNGAWQNLIGTDIDDIG